MSPELKEMVLDTVEVQFGPPEQAWENDSIEENYPEES